MSPLSPSVPLAETAAAADGDMTAARDEIKFVLPRAHLQRFALAMSNRLPHHRFTGRGANPLPRPRHFVTTIYFDTPSRHQYQQVKRDREARVKMRAREYYDLHPSLAELATDPRQIVRYQPVLWLELKYKQGDRTGKRRIGLPKKQVPQFFAEGSVTPEMLELGRRTYGEEGDAVLAEIAEHRRRFPEPLAADCLVSYRRLPWQDAQAQLRVTLDLGIEFYDPPADLWQREQALVRETLGPCRGRLLDGILELKCRGELPEWMQELLQSVAAERVRISKFEQASEAVHGRLD